MICQASGIIGLSGKDRCASFGAQWITRGANLNFGRSIGQNAGLPASSATNLNDSRLRSFAGASYTTPSTPISLGAFYDGARSISWNTSPTTLNEGGVYNFSVITTGFFNGTPLYWHITPLTASTNANFSAVDGVMTINNNAGNSAFGATNNNLPNLYLGDFGVGGSLPVYQTQNGTFRLDIWYGGPYNDASGNQIRVLTTTATLIDPGGPGGTMTFSSPAPGSRIQADRVSVNTQANFNGAPSGWTKTGDRYVIGAANTVRVVLNANYIVHSTSAGTAALTIQGSTNSLDNYQVVVNTDVYGMGGQGASGGLCCGRGRAGGNAINITGIPAGKVIAYSGSGRVAGGGGGGGGHGGTTRSVGGGGAGGGNSGFTQGSQGTGATSWGTSGNVGFVGGSPAGIRGGGGGGSSFVQVADAWGFGEMVVAAGVNQGYSNVGYGGGQGGGGGGCWNFTGAGAGNFRAGRGGQLTAVGGSAVKVSPNGFVGGISGGGGGWGAAGGAGWNLNTGCGSVRPGGAGGFSIKTNGTSYSFSGPTLYGGIGT